MLDPTTLVVLSSAISIIIGVIVGWYYSEKNVDITNTDLRTAIAIVVTVVWVITIAAEILIPAYSVSILIHGIMGAVVGYLFSDEGLNINIGGE